MMGKNGGGAWGSIENLGEYGWWGNGGIFGCWRSWVKYGGNMEEVGKCAGAVKAGKRKMCWGCGEPGKVWEGVGYG